MTDGVSTPSAAGDVRSRLQGALRRGRGRRSPRRAAAREYRAAGHADRAGRLLSEAEAIESALYMAARRDDA